MKIQLEIKKIIPVFANKIFTDIGSSFYYIDMIKFHEIMTMARLQDDTATLNLLNNTEMAIISAFMDLNCYSSYSSYILESGPEYSSIKCFPNYYNKIKSDDYSSIVASFYRECY